MEKEKNKKDRFKEMAKEFDKAVKEKKKPRVPRLHYDLVRQLRRFNKQDKMLPTKLALACRTNGTPAVKKWLTSGSIPSWQVENVKHFLGVEYGFVAG